MVACRRRALRIGLMWVDSVESIFTRRSPTGYYSALTMKFYYIPYVQTLVERFFCSTKQPGTTLITHKVPSCCSILATALVAPGTQTNDLPTNSRRDHFVARTFPHRYQPGALLQEKFISLYRHH